MSNPVSSKQSRSYKDEEKALRRQDIIDAAEQTFFEQGYGKVSMASIAKVAGLSRALIYVYFEDKDDLYRAVMVRASTDLKLRFENAYASKDLGLQKIKAIGHAYYRFYQQEINYFNLLTESGEFLQNLAAKPSEKEQKTLDLLLKTYGDCMVIMVTAISDGVSDGSICKERAADPVKAAYFLRGMLHGVMLSSRSDQTFIDAFCDFNTDELIDYCIDNAYIALSSDHDMETLARFNFEFSGN
ncbi:MAG: TetR/AcrR family transcriptional regulator [Pseudomonadales bacterium]|nr:TetR/AcrR family transcriptional regulator [Pseudomonadales bacterium]